MIKYLNQRNNGSQCEPVIRDCTPGEALKSLVVYELGFGGAVVTIERDCVVVSTRVLNCTDLVTFSGPEDEMQLLVKAAVIHQALLSGLLKNQGYQKNLARRLVELGFGIPLLIKANAGLIRGTSAKLTACLLYDVEPPEYLNRFSLEDVLAITEMAAAEKRSFGQVVMLLDIAVPTNA